MIELALKLPQSAIILYCILLYYGVHKFGLQQFGQVSDLDFFSVVSQVIVAILKIDGHLNSLLTNVTCSAW